MTREQVKQLKELLQTVYASKMAKIPSKYGATPKMPKDILAAARMEKKCEAMVQRWKNQQYKKHEATREKVNRMRQSIETLILFGTAKQALSAIHKFERS